MLEDGCQPLGHGALKTCARGTWAGGRVERTWLCPAGRGELRAKPRQSLTMLPSRLGRVVGERREQRANQGLNDAVRTWIELGRDLNRGGAGQPRLTGELGEQTGRPHAGF